MEIDEAIQDGLDHVHMLADTIGKRPTGFAGERRAAQYLCEQLQRWGLVDVGTEPFAARSWDFEVCRLESGTMEPIEGLPVEFSASTPPGGLEAELLVCESPDHVRIGEIAGKIILVYGGMPTDEVLLEGKPAGFIQVTDNRRAHQFIYGPNRPLAGKLPMLTLGHDDGVELIKRGVGRLTLHIQTTIRDVEGLNVVGTLPAAGEHHINISSHYDSVPASGAAADNATGAACALEVVHALSRSKLDATVDLVVFSAEEIGLYGSAAYAAAHAEQLARTAVGIYFDGQGDFLGRHNIHVAGQGGLVDLVRTLVGEMDYRVHLNHGFAGVDTACLSALGVPTLWFQRGPQLTWHTRDDVSADVSPKAMRESIHAAVQIARHVAADSGCVPQGLPDDQLKQARDYMAAGAPVW